MGRSNNASGQCREMNGVSLPGVTRRMKFRLLIERTGGFTRLRTFRQVGCKCGCSDPLWGTLDDSVSYWAPGLRSVLHVTSVGSSCRFGRRQKVRRTLAPVFDGCNGRGGDVAVEGRDRRWLEAEPSLVCSSEVGSLRCLGNESPMTNWHLGRWVLPVAPGMRLEILRPGPENPHRFAFSQLAHRLLCMTPPLAVGLSGEWRRGSNKARNGIRSRVPRLIKCS